MQNWLVILCLILGVFAFIVAVAAVMGFVIIKKGKKAKARFISEDSEKIASALPGKDCGSCGFPTCAAYAEHLASTLSFPSACPELEKEAKEKIDATVSARRALLLSGNVKRDRYYPD